MINFSLMRERLVKREYDRFLAKRRARLRRSDFSIICTNCIGGVMYHDLSLEFLTPTVNLTISMPDLVKLAGNLKWYMEQPLLELDLGKPYPVAQLGEGDDSIQVDFIHYDTFQDAQEKWEERKRKINYDRLVLIGAEKQGCNYEILRRFDQLPWPNKLIFTRVPYPEFSSACYIKGFEDQSELGTLTNFKPQFFKRRYMDDFDYVSFLNGLQ
nr:DUF1919 domain-containing protein [uncultured Oscillibacter sp.]